LLPIAQAGVKKSAIHQYCPSFQKCLIEAGYSTGQARYSTPQALPLHDAGKI